MIVSRETLHEIAATWNLFSGRKLPAGNADAVAGYMILPGILIGIPAAFAAWCGTILFGKTAAGIAAAILFTLIYELLSGWNGLRNTTAFHSFQLDGIGNPFGAESQRIEIKGITPLFILLSLYLLRALAIGATAASAPGLFILVFTASFLIRFELTTLSNEMHEPLLEATSSERMFTYRLAVLVFILEPILSFHLVNFARSFLIALAMLLICILQKRKIGRGSDKISYRRLSVYSYTAELLLLYTALAVL